jgi:Reeler domain
MSIFCLLPQNSITHKKIAGEGVNSLTFRWIAPAQLRETVVFKATIALNGGVFWVGHSSQPLTVS